MAKLCVCLETVFTDLPFVERIGRVADLGYEAVEFWFHDQDDGREVAAIADSCEERGLVISDFVVNSPDGSIGGSLVRPEDRALYLSHLREVIPVAHQLNCEKLITCTGNAVAGRSKEEQTQSIIETLREAAEIASAEGITLVLEPLNSIVDHAGYFLDSPHDAAAIVREIGCPAIRLLFDCYHMQIMAGNLIQTIAENIDIIGHFHSAGVPGRHELDDGELNYPAIVSKIDELGYQGYFGLEYFPALPSEESLARMRELLTGTPY